MTAFEIKPGESWRGYGTENGTLEKVYLSGKSAEDVQKKARARPYSINLHSIWEKKETQ